MYWFAGSTRQMDAIIWVKFCTERAKTTSTRNISRRHEYSTILPALMPNPKTLIIREQDPNQSDGINLCEFTRKNYELVKEPFGLTAAVVIHNGVEYAIELKKAYRRIEASRLLINLAADSRSVLGPEHHITKKPINSFKIVKNDSFVFREHSSKLCDTKMMEPCVSSRAPSKIRGRLMEKESFIIRVISYIR